MSFEYFRPYIATMRSLDGKTGTAGAKARRRLCGTFGTTEVVPCYKALKNRTQGEFLSLVKPSQSLGDRRHGTQMVPSCARSKRHAFDLIGDSVEGSYFHGSRAAIPALCLIVSAQVRALTKQAARSKIGDSVCSFSLLPDKALL